MNKIEVGKKYPTRARGDFECIFVEDGIAWMRGGKDHEAYRWDALTGETLSMGVAEYNIVFPPREFWVCNDHAYENKDAALMISYTGDEIIHVREVLK